MNPEQPGGLRDIAVAVGEHALDVFPLDACERWDFDGALIACDTPRAIAASTDARVRELVQTIPQPATIP